jgi:hypothetical protein
MASKSQMCKAPRAECVEKLKAELAMEWGAALQLAQRRPTPRGPKRFSDRPKSRAQNESTLFFNIHSAHDPGERAIWGQSGCFGLQGRRL